VAGSPSGPFSRSRVDTRQRTRPVAGEAPCGSHRKSPEGVLLPLEGEAKSPMGFFSRSPIPSRQLDRDHAAALAGAASVHNRGVDHWIEFADAAFGLR
jgi:hypothetical protein